VEQQELKEPQIRKRPMAKDENADKVGKRS